jgi:hypothetical protein
VYSCFFFILVIVLLYLSKNPLVFNDNGKLKHFGVYPDCTIFSFGVFSIVLAILSFYVFAVLDIFR